jgi:catechol 2,3-dioxygenase
MTMYQTKLGHAQLKVRDLPRAIEFYTRFCGLQLIEQVGDDYAFLGDASGRRELALQQIGPYAPAAPARGVGLAHLGFEVADRESFVRAYRALQEAGVCASAVDHRISWALYFADPDGNGVEIHWDTRDQPGGAALWRGRNVTLPACKLDPGSGTTNPA